MHDGTATALLDRVEDLEAQAHAAFETSRTLCRGCRSYHAIYPFMRLAGRKRGVDADRDILAPLLARIIAGGARRILLAGSADPGLMALVLHAAGHHPVAVTVIDLCPTPLATCRSVAAQWGHTVRTRAVCLSEMTFEDEFDLVVAHSVLSFVPPARHAAVGARLARALVPGGRLVMATSVSAQKIPVDAAALRADVLSGLRRAGVRLPAGEAEFGRLLVEYSGYQRDRINPWGTVDELVAYLAAHRLEVGELIPKSRITGYTADGQCVDRGSPGVIVTARRIGGGGAGLRP